MGILSLNIDNFGNTMASATALLEYVGNQSPTFRRIFQQIQNRESTAKETIGIIPPASLVSRLLLDRVSFETGMDLSDLENLSGSSISEILQLRDKNVQKLEAKKISWLEKILTCDPMMMFTLRTDWKILGLDADYVANLFKTNETEYLQVRSAIFFAGLHELVAEKPCNS